MKNMLRRFLKYVFPVLLGFIATHVFAADADMTGGIMTDFESVAKEIHTQLITPALGTACAAVTLQWILTYHKEIFSGDMTSSLAKVLGLVTWFGATVFLIRDPNLLTDAFKGYLGFGSSLSGISASDFTPAALVGKGIDMIDGINKAFNDASNAKSLSLTNIASNLAGAFMLIFANIFTFVAFLVIALSLFVAQLEFWVMFSVAPLAFALIPLSAFRDQGFAPIKGMISLGLRLVILGLVVAVTMKLTTKLTGRFASLPADANIMRPIWYYLAGMAGCAMMSISAGKIASSIASGSASFSGSDAIKGGMQMAAIGAVGAAGVMGASKTAGSALGSLPAAGKTAGTLAGKGASAMSAVQEFMSGGKVGVNPVGGSDSKAADAWKSFGGPAVEPRPSVGDVGQSSTGAPGADGVNGGDGSDGAKGQKGDAGANGSAATSAAASASSVAGTPTSASTPASATGDASTAGISGSGMSNEQLMDTLKPKEATALQKLGSATRGSADQLAQDGHTVAVQMHIGKD